MLLSLRWWCKKAYVSIAVVLAIVASLAFAAGSGAVEDSSGVMLDVKDAPLAQVVLMLTQQSGMNIVIADPEVNAKRVTAHLDGLPLEKVLDYVLKPAGIRYHKSEDGTYIIGESGVDVASVVEPPVPVNPVSIPQEPQQKARRVRTESIKLHNSSPSELLRSLGWNGGQVLPGAAVTTGPGMDIDQNFKWKPTTRGASRMSAPSGGIGIENIDPAPPVKDMEGSIKRSSEAGRTADTSTGADQYSLGSSARPMNTGGNTYGTYGSNQNRPQGNAQGSSSSGSGSLLPEGIDFVMPYDIDNSIVVRGDDEGIAEFKDLVHMLDIPPKQVNIKAEFIEVSTTDAAKLGIDWSIERLNATFNTDFNPTGNVLIGVQTGNVTAQLAAELTKSTGRVVNSPIVSTLNNTPATIEIGKSIPFFTATTSSVGNGQLVTSESVTQLDVATYLFVLPRVNGDGSITVYLEPSIQDTGRIFKSPQGSELPETSYQTVRTNRRVMNGETIVVGGFFRKNDTASVTKVPILGDLPIIGNFFRSKTSQEDERELLIFLTPTIIPDKSGVGSVGVQP